MTTPNIGNVLRSTRKSIHLPIVDERLSIGKAGKQEKAKLGHNSCAAESGPICKLGIPLTQKDKDHIELGWKTYAGQGHSVRDAYLLTMALFWAKGETTNHVPEIPELRHRSECPTLAQFRYWGSRGEGVQPAQEALLKRVKSGKKYRAQDGVSRDRVKAVAKVVSVDFSWSDVHWVRRGYTSNHDYLLNEQKPIPDGDLPIANPTGETK